MATVTPATCRNRWHKQMASDRLGPVLLWPRPGRCQLKPVDEARWWFVQTLLCSTVASKRLKVNLHATEEDLQIRVSLLLLQCFASLMVAGIIHAYRTDK